MLSRMLDFFAGRVQLYAEAKHRDRLVALIARESIPAKIKVDSESGGVFVLLSPENAKKLALALDKTSIIVYINNVRGLKATLISSCKRIGLLLGVIAFFTLLSLSTLFVFNVEVSGSELIAVQDVKAELADFGIRVGARLDGINREAAANRFLQLHPELSWAAISFKGTTVRLELKEKSEASNNTAEKPPLLVADSDGIVQSVLVYSGKTAVAQGAVVKKGDLLISGYISGNGLQYTDNPQLRYEGADGKVLAQVRDSVSVTVPFCEQSVSKSAEKRVGFSLNIFGRVLTFGEVSADDEHKITPERNLTVWGKIELPITYTECFYVTRTEQITERDELQATELARARAYEQLTLKAQSAELLQTDAAVVADENGVTVTVEYVCIRNIAVPKFKE